MKEQKLAGEPGVRKGFLLGLGGFIVLAVLVLATLRPTKHPQTQAVEAMTAAPVETAAGKSTPLPTSQELISRRFKRFEELD